MNNTFFWCKHTHTQTHMHTHTHTYIYIRAQVANMYLTNYDTFVSTARFWTDCYATIREDG